ncbi:MAG: hypothetical protein ACK5KM_14230 [Hyphomicrobiaceae bacterium]
MNADASLWQSARNILSAQDNLNKLFESIDCVTTTKTDLVIEFNWADKSNEDWLQPVWNQYYDVKKSSRSNARATGSLTIAIQLTCDDTGAQWEHGRRAKVVVGYSDARDDFWAFDVTHPNAGGEIDEYCKANNTHWSGTYDKGIASWVYAVPLDVLTSTDAVEKYIKEPNHKILRGEERNEVLSGIRDALCVPPQSSASD